MNHGWFESILRGTPLRQKPPPILNKKKAKNICRSLLFFWKQVLIKWDFKTKIILCSIALFKMFSEKKVFWVSAYLLHHWLFLMNINPGRGWSVGCYGLLTLLLHLGGHLFHFNFRPLLLVHHFDCTLYVIKKVIVDNQLYNLILYPIISNSRVFRLKLKIS